MSYIFYNTNAAGQWVGSIKNTAAPADVVVNNIVGDFKLVTEKTDSRINATHCVIQLLADAQNTFQDLYTENERQIEFVLTLNEDIIFKGWINPDGIFQNQVAKKWYISLRATDGLDALKNLAYVAPNGLKYLGYTNVERVVSQALLRLRDANLYIGKVNTATNSNFYLNYLTGVGQETKSFWELKCNQDAFFNGEDISTCAEVIEEILELCNCQLFHFRGNWHILHEYDYSSALMNNTELKAFSYKLSSGFVGNVQWIFNYNVGERSGGYNYYFVNTNQRTNTLPSLGAIRYAWDFGDPVSNVGNPNLNHDGTTLTGFTLLSILDADFSLFENAGVTVGMVSRGNGTIGENSLKYFFETNGIYINTEDVFKVAVNWASQSAFRFDNGAEVTFSTAPQIIYLEIEHVSDNGVVRYYTGNDWWEQTAQDYNILHRNPFISFAVNNTFTSVQSRIENIIAPDNGTIKMRFFRRKVNATTASSSWFRVFPLIQFVDVVLVSENDGSIGIEHTAKQAARSTSVVKNSKTVLLSNSEDGLLRYNRTLLNAVDTDLLQGFVIPKNNNPRPLLRLITEEAVREKQTPAIQYSGDVRGYIPRIARVNINGFVAPFKVVSTSYDSVKNITSLVLEEVKEQPNVNEGIRYTRQLKYNNTVKPTIV